mmetsp:Transcript_52948/g.172318  ORF Transcript_52948/g.172318 Transcript_52948/m.172318 type:complete len:328 (-) Transcript_52948:2165-3148(-)
MAFSRSRSAAHEESLAMSSKPVSNGYSASVASSNAFSSCSICAVICSTRSPVRLESLHSRKALLASARASNTTLISVSLVSNSCFMASCVPCERRWRTACATDIRVACTFAFLAAAVSMSSPNVSLPKDEASRRNSFASSATALMRVWTSAKLARASALSSACFMEATALRTSPWRRSSLPSASAMALSVTAQLPGKALNFLIASTTDPLAETVLVLTTRAALSTAFLAASSTPPTTESSGSLPSPVSVVEPVNVATFSCNLCKWSSAMRTLASTPLRMAILLIVEAWMLNETIFFLPSATRALSCSKASFISSFDNVVVFPRILVM